MATRKLYNYKNAMALIDENKNQGKITREQLEIALELEGDRKTNSSYSSAISLLKSRCQEQLGLSIKAKTIDDVSYYVITKYTKASKAPAKELKEHSYDAEKALQANNMKLFAQKEELELKCADLELKCEELLQKELEYKNIIASLSKLAAI